VEHVVSKIFESESIYPRINRVKIIDKNGKVLDFIDVEGTRMLVQEGGETLKVVLL